MAFKKKSKSSISLESPQSLFRDLRNRQIKGLLDHQSEMIDAYLEDKAFKHPNVALELPTGSGKTLIGLLIGEYRRRKNKEQIVYLCPTKQLVNQVVEQSKVKYGITTYAFTGKKSEFKPTEISEYKRGNAIGVTTYNGLFNTNPFFKKPDILILDDTHSAENYISSLWSLSINRFEYNNLYKSIIELLKNQIDDIYYQRLISEESSIYDLEWIDKLPYPKMYNIIDDLVSIIDENTYNNDLSFSWSMIRDNIFGCNMYLSWNNILIRPVIPPTMTHQPFANAKQRIYMSATLGASGELERITGVSDISRLPVPEGWDQQGLGRRLFFFPEAKFTEEESDKIVLEMATETDRSLMLVPDDKTVDEYKNIVDRKTDLKVFDKYSLEDTKKDFIDSNNSIAILANRFDGIDLSDEECRFLIIKNLPKGTHLQEKFLISRMAASVIFEERIRTRIIQAIGRCTRNPIDYAAICILGQEITDELILEKKIKYFHPELQSEIVFGFDQSKDIEDKDELIENLEIFLEHEQEWDEADEYILEERKGREMQKLNTFNKLLDAAKNEVDYQYAIWKNDYERALTITEKIINDLSGDDVKGYRGFWYYLAGNAAFHAYKQGDSVYENKYREKYRRASACTQSVTWFKNISNLESKEPVEEKNFLLSFLIERLEKQIEKIGISSNRKFERKVKNILNLLTSQDGKKFEEGHKQLGELIGFISKNSDDNAAPDPRWILGDKFCIVFEDKIYENDDKPICVSDVRQTALHYKWIQENENDLSNDAEIYTVMISNSLNIDKDAVAFADNILYWNFDEFIEWVRKMVSLIRELRSSFNGVGDLTWRETAFNLLKDRNLTPLDLINFLEKNPLNHL